MISLTSNGNYKKTREWLAKLAKLDITSDLHRYGARGVAALSKATPSETGLTAYSWNYRLVKNNRGEGIEWYNTHVVSGANIAILIQYGHGTGTGGYVAGRDYINPAIRPIFADIANDIRKKVRG